MAVMRPAGVLCPKWEPNSVGSRRCRYFIDPNPDGGGSVEGLCKLPSELLCVEWVRRFGTADQQQTLRQRNDASIPHTPPRSPAAQLDPDAPGPLVLEPTQPAPPRAAREPPTRPPATVQTAGGIVAIAPPKPFEPAKAIDGASLEALERAGVEVELAAPYLDEPITVVAARTGRTDRVEITWREMATIRLVVDAFPGAHVTAYRGGRAGSVIPAASLNGTGTGHLDDDPLDQPFEASPLTGTRCSVCGQPQRQTPGGLSCTNGHGGAEPLEEDPLS